MNNKRRKEQQRQEIQVTQGYFEGRTDGGPAEDCQQCIGIGLALLLHAAKLNVFFYICINNLFDDLKGCGSFFLSLYKFYTMKKLAVVALGGNALLQSDQKGTIDEQESNALATADSLVKLLKRDYNIVITHGNGPQVGNIMLANSAGFKMFGIPEMPLDICVAYSQGFIGYIIEQQLKNVLNSLDMERDIITIATQVLVNKLDPAFKNPTKPVGPFYSKEESEKFAAETGSVYREDARGRGWRKVVASPKPLVIINKKTIEKIAREGNIVIAVGGGGIPVFYVETNKLQGIDAVIDKDLASALLASQINADKFFILTDVPKVCLNYNTPQETTIDRMTIAEAQQYLDEGQFPDGSMGPKIRAAIRFVENSGKDTIITKTTMLGIDNGGTRITLV
jgi:carbamate kinase